MGHLKDVSMTYTEHLIGAWGEIIFALIMVSKLIVHSIFPSLFVTCYTDYIIGCHKRRSIKLHKDLNQNT
jgi:hypothetical protein